jgi:hypothetical protein
MFVGKILEEATVAHIVVPIWHLLQDQGKPPKTLRQRRIQTKNLRNMQQKCLLKREQVNKLGYHSNINIEGLKEMAACSPEAR